MATNTPLRADAARNRGRILAAAAELFAAKGLSVGLHEIAHHAGVGVGTAYRRFPDERQLIEALFEERLDRLAEVAERALAADDPWDGLAGFLEQATELQIQNRGLREIITGSDHGSALTARARATLAPATEQLVRRAQASGTLRADVVAADLPLYSLAEAQIFGIQLVGGGTVERAVIVRGEARRRARRPCRRSPGEAWTVV
jgi:AcrR family transcriptional regulator